MPRKSTRHPTEQKGTNPTYSPPFVSCGKNEKRLLGALKNKKDDERFNIKAFSRNSNIARTTIVDALNRLINKGLVSKPNIGHYVITTKGKDYFNITNSNFGGVGLSRGGCRVRGKLSQHMATFKFKITNNNNFNIKKLNPIDKHENKLNNLYQQFLYFEDATITINPKVVLIRVEEIIGDSVDETNLKSLDIAIKYIGLLNEAGLKGDTLELENSHYARINSSLSGFLEKIDNRYSLKLKDGYRLWIDHSNGGREDETDSEDARKRIDEVLLDALDSTSLLSDVDKMKEVIGLIIKRDLIKNLPLQNESTLTYPDYIQ